MCYGIAMHDPTLRILFAVEALLLLAAGATWWRVYRRPRDDWQGNAAMLTAAAFILGGIVLGVLILR